MANRTAKAALGALTVGSRGEPQSLDILYHRYWVELRVYVERTFGLGPPEPDDVAQTAFIKFAAYSKDIAVENPRAFLYATARNIVLDHRRRARVIDAHAVDVQHTATESSYEISPERVLLDKERLALFVEALKAMPVHRRRMVLMNRFHNLSCEEIGRRLGVSTSTVQKQVVQGIAECLRHLGEKGGTEPAGGMKK